MAPVPYLLLLLLPLLRVSADELEPCQLDDEDFRCVCNFTDPEPDWSSALQCMVAVEVEIRGGGRSLEQFLKKANSDPKQYVDMVRALRLRRLTELTLEDLEVTSLLPPPPVKDPGPALSTLRIHNVSWATGDLSDNPGLSERGLTTALCPHKFPALQDLALRNAGMETPSGVCAALAAAGVQLHRLDLSHNSLRAAASDDPRVLDLSCNRLNRAPRPDELPEVSNLTLDGNPLLDPGALKHQEDPMPSGVVPACARSALTVGVSGTLALLQGARGYA
ncbi:monocyte differentiation antigen CD14 precursor [Camelus ferus]|nr:monocyte differentiation antigen CD14 precursor [Camelus ferus]